MCKRKNIKKIDKNINGVAEKNVKEVNGNFADDGSALTVDTMFLKKNYFIELFRTKKLYWMNGTVSSTASISHCFPWDRAGSITFHNRCAD